MSPIQTVPATPPAAPQSRRVVFVDLARAVAAVFMLYGHALDALLAPEYRMGTWHDVWLFQRGLTSCLFLMLSGFAFSIATARHWPGQLTLSPVLIRRARRFGMFILLGYALHVPIVPLTALRDAPDTAWLAFLGVDVLQLIGVTFVVVQGLVMILRARHAVTVATLLLAVVIPLATPGVWRTDWSARLPVVVAAYLSPATGSLFPVFPWSAFILLGVGLGQVYALWGVATLSRYVNGVLLAPGVALVVLWSAVTAWTGDVAGRGPDTQVPEQVLLRAGVCLLILAAVAHASRVLARLPHVISAFSQETLVVYFVHICLVYGSIYNPGLAHLFGPTLTPVPMAVTIVLLVAAMLALASVWNRWKHMHPRRVRQVTATAGALMLLRLLLPV